MICESGLSLESAISINTYCNFRSEFSIYIYCDESWSVLYALLLRTLDQTLCEYRMRAL